MPKRCQNPECGPPARLVHEDRNRSPNAVFLGDRVFCGNFCLQEWQENNKLFETAAHPFHEPLQRRRMNGG